MQDAVCTALAARQGVNLTPERAAAVAQGLEVLTANAAHASAALPFEAEPSAFLLAMQSARRAP